MGLISTILRTAWRAAPSPEKRSPPETIQIRVERLAQLFDALDPLPIAERDLSEPTERFIVEWARELPRSRPLRIVVHVPPEGASTSQKDLGEALRHHFSYLADRTTSDLREMFRIGRLSLLIGLSVLAVCVMVGQVLSPTASTNYFSRFFNEGLIIVGWVANWRPIEIFLYRWWPLLRQRELYTRLARADIQLEHREAGAAPAAPVLN